MKGSSSARLPKISTGYLVAKQQGNTVVNRKKEKQKTNAKKSKKTCPVRVTNVQHVNPLLGHIHSGKEELCTSKLSELITPVQQTTPEAFNVTQQQADSIRRHEPHHIEKCKLYRKESATSLEQRRLVSAKSRDRLLSLMPTQETMELLMNEDLFSTARQEMNRMRQRYDNNRTMIRDEISQQKSSTLLQQAQKAARINRSIIGTRDRTNNCHSSIEYDIVFGARSHTVRPTLRMLSHWGTHPATTLSNVLVQSEATHSARSNHRVEDSSDRNGDMSLGYDFYS